MAVDGSWSGVTLLAPLSDDLLDVKGNVVTVNGDAALSATVGTPFGAGNACYFDGTGDYLTTPQLIFSDLYTVELWMYLTSTAQQCIFSQYDSVGTNRLSLHTNASGKLEVAIDGTPEVTATATVTTGAWVFVSLTSRTAFGDGLYLHAGGVQVAGASSTLLAPYSGACTFGARYGPTAGLELPMTGYLFDCRVTSLTARYGNSSYSVPTEPHPRPTIAGVTYDEFGAELSQVVVALKRDTLAIAGSAVSDVVTGSYVIYPDDFSEHVVLRFDTTTYPLVDGGGGENALIFDQVIPG